MGSFRALIRHYRVAAMLLVVAALCLKAAIPAGMMIATHAAHHAKAVTVEICADASGHEAPRKLVIPMKTAPSGSAAKGECPFTALSLAALSAADPALLALAIAFVIAIGFAPVRAIPARMSTYLRPPLRGPPAFA